MNQNDRALGRQGARELTPSEAEVVAGAFRLFTICTPGDGDCCEALTVHRENTVTLCTFCAGSRDGDC